MMLFDRVNSSAPFEWLSRLDISLETYVVLFLVTYLLLVRLLRHRREEQMRKKFNYPNKESFKAMTNDDAFAIQSYVAELEFPTMFEKALQFALFKVGFIPLV